MVKPLKNEKSKSFEQGNTACYKGDKPKLDLKILLFSESTRKFLPSHDKVAILFTIASVLQTWYSKPSSQRSKSWKVFI